MRTTSLKFFLILVGFVCLPAIVAADCYTTLRQKAIEAYNRGEYDRAKSTFQSAKEDCPDTPSNNDIDSWIQKCNRAKNQAQQVQQTQQNNTFGRTNTIPTDLYNGHEYVDLGLSVKWAACNVGANRPEEYGNYFAWGETTPKSNYDWSNYKYCNGTAFYLTKYNTQSKYGIVDNKLQLDVSDDVACANWGGCWRMPTDAEWTELREMCIWTWTARNGISGYKVTSKCNGKSIFLPAAKNGYDSDLRREGRIGAYWSSLVYTTYPSNAWFVHFGSARVVRNYGNRSGERSVRPVCP
ncbi:MAG: hypothetical protein IJV81_03790 [Paludibacteraceae bacterium]|nr:hypothetical protein [Paludibacteraceae bacterium]